MLAVVIALAGVAFAGAVVARERILPSKFYAEKGVKLDISA